MYPTLSDGEYIIAEKLSLKYRNPQLGDVVIFNHPEKEGVLLVKRIVALPNTVAEGGKPVPESSYYVLGDNRENSSDSRELGPVGKNSIEGRVLAVVYPLKNVRLVRR